MLLYFILLVASIFFGYLFFMKNSELRELQKYTANLENDLLQKQIKFEEIAQHSKLTENNGFLQNAVDPITGLPTPQVFEDRALQAFHMSSRFGKSFGILFLDIRDFDKINQDLGTEKSNLLLSEIAKVLNGCIRQIDTLTRYRADIFLFLLPQLAQPETAAYVAQRLLAKLAKPIIIEGKSIQISASIGIAVYPVDGDSVNVLINHANDALKRAKLSTDHQYYFHSDALQEITVRELEIAKTLTEPDLNARLLVYCLPQVNAVTNKIIAIKALPYLQDAKLGLLTYEDYYRIAEHENKILYIMGWLISQAITQFKQWQSMGLKPERLAINVSAKQIQNDDFIRMLTKILQENNFPPSFLAFEVSAENFSENATAIQESFMRLKNLGVQLSIGVFALGHLAIQKITQLPISYLKIDQRLIKSLTTYSENELILTALMDLSHTMGLITIVEGVDEEQQKVLLSKLGFEVMQGKLFGEPQPIQFFMR